MSLYPSLEDFKIDKMAQAQVQFMATMAEPVETATEVFAQPRTSSFYPSLDQFMGLELSTQVLAENIPNYDQIAVYQAQSVSPYSSLLGDANKMVAPLSGGSLGLKRAEVNHAIRNLILCKDRDGKVGLRVQAINNGIFVCLVSADSPAALAGLRFGDQILEVNDTSVAGFSMDKVHELFRKSSVNGISVVVRDRPFERTLTLHKDSTGHIGFQFKNGKIERLVKDSSAARNGLLTDHQLLEVNGQNVVGIKDKEIVKIIDKGSDIITVTVMPCFLYDHMIKKMSTSLLKGIMDHSIPSI